MSCSFIGSIYRVEVKAQDEQTAKKVIQRQYPEADIYFARKQNNSYWLVVFEM